MAAKGVCTSPNGVIGCKSATCPGSSFTANLESLRFYSGEVYETKKYGSRDEWDSMEANLNITVDSLMEDYLELDDESRKEIRDELKVDDLELMEEYSSDFKTSDIIAATTSFDRDTIDSIVAGYFEAAVWTDMNENEEPVHEEAADYFTKYSHSSSVRDVYSLLANHPDVVKSALDAYGAERFGHDFWLTRNNHGVGFWDREELKANGVGEELTRISNSEFKEKSLIVSDEGFYEAE
jgi:hypothetical protein